MIQGLQDRNNNGISFEKKFIIGTTVHFLDFVFEFSEFWG